MKGKIIVGSVVGLTAAVLYSREANRLKRRRALVTEGSESESHVSTSTDSSSSSAKRNDPAVTELGSSMGRMEHEETSHPVDDQGTNQAEASAILRYIRDNAFDGNNEKLALALGRSAEEIEDWTNGSDVIDSDGLIKARALAIQRGLEDKNLIGDQSTHA